MMDPTPQQAAGMPAVPPPAGTRVRIPLARPVVTYILLAAIVAMFVLETARGGSTRSQVLLDLGAQVNTLVAQGDMWRLLSAMFLHIGVTHIAFNGWALFSLGRDVEAFYGPVWFAVLYFVAGLAGNVAYYMLGRDGLSAGASGAVFGLIGAEVAYFVLNRRLFGAMGRQRLGNLAVLIVINLVFGFTVPGINNLAHLGGLVAGFLVGLGVGPRYKVEPEIVGGVMTPRLVDRKPAVLRVSALLLAVLVLAAGVRLGNGRWTGSAELLRSQAQEAYDAGDLASAQTLLQQAVASNPNDRLSLFNLGVVYLQSDETAKAIEVLERARDTDSEDPDTLFVLGAAYASTGRLADARPLMEKFLESETAGDRAAYARGVLTQAP